MDECACAFQLFIIMLPVPRVSAQPQELALSMQSDNEGRKRIFKRFVSRLAEQLNGDDAKNIIWQTEISPPNSGQAPLDVLVQLYVTGYFDENRVHRLSQLFRDIHRQDLAAKVDSFKGEG